MTTGDAFITAMLLALWLMVGATAALYVRSRTLRRIAVLIGPLSIVAWMVKVFVHRVVGAWNGGEP
jgi:hypothetical protein